MSYDGEYFLEGEATKTGTFFVQGDEAFYFEPNCFNAARGEVKLLLSHDESQVLGSTRNRLELHYAPDVILFRFRLPASFKSEVEDIADSFEDYFAISIGFVKTDFEKSVMDGFRVQIIRAARLTELSVLAKEVAPAVTSTYGRIVHASSSGTLAEDYESGRFSIAGRMIGLHRKVTALDNEGKITYGHVTTQYDRKADKFVQALARLG
jgi:phage head maturation protease